AYATREGTFCASVPCFTRPRWPRRRCGPRRCRERSPCCGSNGRATWRASAASWLPVPQKELQNDGGNDQRSDKCRPQKHGSPSASPRIALNQRGSKKRLNLRIVALARNEGERRGGAVSGPGPRSSA